MLQVKRLDLGTHNVTTVCGGVIGDCDGLGQQARFNMPFGIRVGKSSDCASSFQWRKQAGTQQDGSCRNVLFVADCGNNKVKQIDLDTFDTVTLTGQPRSYHRTKNCHTSAWVILGGPTVSSSPPGSCFAANGGMIMSLSCFLLVLQAPIRWEERGTWGHGTS